VSPADRKRGRRGTPSRGGGSKGGASRGGSHGAPDRSRGRDRAGRGLGGEQVEGRQAVRELLVAGRRKVHELIVSAPEGRQRADELEQLAAELGVPVRQVSRTKFDADARTEAPQGVIARAAPLDEVDLVDLTSRRAGAVPFLVAVDGVTDPGNLGAILRSAECAGATGIVLPRHRAVHVTPAAAKAAAGAIEHLPMAVVGGLPTALAELKERGVWVVGLDGGGDRSVHDLTFADEPIVLVIGSEGRGLSRLVRERCDVLVRIPLAGALDSLNASAAAAVACFEVAHRRGG
jgi:23S rRNA (guanosine2251-2'-O)-methyltransferase